MIKTLLVFFLLSLPVASASQSDPLLNACGQYKLVDAEMNRLYQQVLKEHSQDRLFSQKLRAAQRAWLAYRDAHLESLYPAADKRLAYGSVYNNCQCLGMIDLTTRRSNDLLRWIQGTKEGDVCAGSVRIKR